MEELNIQITREKEIEIEEKKEKVGVTFDIPMELFKTKSEIEEEFGDVGMDGRTTEQIFDELFGGISSSLANYIVASLYSGSDIGLGFLILQESITSSAIKMAKVMRARKEMEKMC